MSGPYEELLEATIHYLEGLKSRGARHVAVAPQTLRAMALPAPKVQISDLISPNQNIAAAVEANVPDNPEPMTTKPALSGSNPPSRNLNSAFEPGAGALEADRQESAVTKAASFEALRLRVLACTKCPHLASSRKSVVFGVGNLQARLMFVGEAPGVDEDRLGEPFVGRAGELLTKIIQAAGWRRSDVYIANILKCRPDTPGQTSGNRKPLPAEMATCIPYLHEQIDYIRPEILVALGATAVEGLLGKAVSITKMRGSWQTYRGIPLMPTYHPSYLLHNQAITEKRKVWEDMLAVMEKLALPISEKQRNYFLKA